MFRLSIVCGRNPSLTSMTSTARSARAPPRARDAGPADPVEQRGLPVVHVPEDGDDGLADGGGHTPRIKNPTLLEGSSLRSVVVRDRATPPFLRMVVEAKEDAVRVLDVDDAVAVPADPNLLLHELPEFRILFPFRDRR